MQKTIICKKKRIIFSSDFFAKFDSSFFNKKYWQEKNKITQIKKGRSFVYFIKHNKNNLVLKEYLRGGFIAKFNKNKYFSLTYKQSRSYKEMLILNQLNKLGLNVPKFVALEISKVFFFIQKEKTITTQIENSQNLDEILKEKNIPKKIWQNIGKYIGYFHKAGLCHKDLNCKNILIDNKNKIYFIDFDRAIFRKKGYWQQANLNRLNRSFLKQKTLNINFHFAKKNWQELEKGYKAI